MTWLVGDRVHVCKSTAFTSPGPATIVGIDTKRLLPVMVTLDNEEEPFDVMYVADDEIVSLSSRESNAPKET